VVSGAWTKRTLRSAADSSTCSGRSTTTDRFDVYLSDRRDTAAAQRFFEGAMAASGRAPTRVTTDIVNADADLVLARFW
jgi:hypothetical protein